MNVAIKLTIICYLNFIYDHLKQEQKKFNVSRDNTQFQFAVNAPVITDMSLHWK